MENLSELHFLAMKCYKKYGGYLISFILSLPVMKFGNKEGIPFIKKESHDGSISSFAIKFKNQTDEYFFVFYPAKQITDKAKAIATIFNKSKRKVEGTISKEGYFERSVKARIYRDEFLFRIGKVKIP
ncbi:MAG: hypothetical protein IPH46_10865 [Bacteroidetes bacterium]|nr:hypothetical protein [Bacteroidota bacterium]